jgi:hypothetical protein
VLEDEGGLDALKALGAKSIPVVSRDGKFVFAQLIKDVVEFLGINEDVSPTLSPKELVARGDLVWEAASRFCAQMPDSALDKELPNRPRSYRVLMHHLFQIPTAFLDARRDSGSLTYEALVSPPPEGVDTGADIARFGTAMRQTFKAWANAEGTNLGKGQMQTYYGEQPAHEVLERTVWHSTQHVRQIMSLLEQEGVTVDQPLGDEAFNDLPLPRPVWDE